MNHVCAPEWECRLEDHGDEDWETIHALDAETAAEKFAEVYDCEGGEYAIVGGRIRNCIIQVRKPDGSDVTRWAIEAETVPQYRATQTD
jgi:hypothetical protein